MIPLYETLHQQSSDLNYTQKIIKNYILLNDVAFVFPFDPYEQILRLLHLVCDQIHIR